MLYICYIFERKYENMRTDENEELYEVEFLEGFITAEMYLYS